MPDAQTASRPRIMFALTSHVSWTFYDGQVSFLKRSGFEVEAVSGEGAGLLAMAEEGAETWAVRMEREISPLRDLFSLFRLWLLFRRRRPDLVIAGTPKAGLLGTLAARLAGVKNIVYLVLGLRLETASGWKRRVLWATEWMACHSAHCVRCVSRSLQARVTSLGLVADNCCHVVGSGTVNGIDVEHWRRDALSDEIEADTREALNIPREALVIGFVGRFTRDKGIPELYEAFSRLRGDIPNLRLLLVGDFEQGDPVGADLRTRIEADSSVHCIGFVSDPARFYWVMDVLAFPTYREGLPGVPLEAQAASLPVVTTDATGAIDSIMDGVSGIRVPVGDVDVLTAALRKLIGDAGLRARMGMAGSAWVEKNFRRENVWEGLLADYRSILQTTSAPRRSSVALGLKRGLDCLIAGVALLVFSPLWLATAVAIGASMGRPIFFRQIRPGLRGRPFTLAKFRTMCDARDQNGRLLDDAHRLTPLGRFLRASSLDELPQLWNVLRGDMSLVGPRPLLMQYLDRYTPEQARRHEVKPGITGWAQVNGRNAVSWEEKFDLDLWYVDHWSLSLDLRILWLTFMRVVRRDGISQQGHATMPEFMGQADHSRQ
jgi:lipopolysaccharide/colanic/teichoic acid biosynthesis glycosyltransferase